MCCAGERKEVLKCHVRIAFYFLRKLMPEVSEFHPTRSLFLSVSVQPQQLILVPQIELFVFPLQPIHTVLLVSLRTLHY